MKKYIRKPLVLFYICLSLCFLSSCSDKLAGYSISSPDEHLVVLVGTDSLGRLGYQFSAHGEELIDFSLLGYQAVMESGDSINEWKILAEKRSNKGVWKPVWGKREAVRDDYNELDLHLVDSQDNQKLSILFRVFDDGFAFKYIIPSDLAVYLGKSKELTEFNFKADYTAWFYNGEFHNLGPDLLTEVEGKRRPVMTVKASDKHYMAVHEANLLEGEPLVLFSEAGKTKFSVVSTSADLKGGYESAWRVVFYGRTPGKMVDSHLIELLNPEPKGDFSWVKPGVSVWDWRVNGAKTSDGFLYTMTYPTWVRMVDFAAAQGFRSLVLDANWYGPEHESDSNPLTGDKVDDVKRILQYGKEKGVGIWLYLNDVGGRKFPIEKTLKQYGEWGAAGVKYGFMTGTPEEKNHWTKMITALCAENKLLVDFHDNPVHPYGQMRTWPNALAREYCQAQLDAHRVFPPSTFVTAVYVNMLAGPIDMNNGMFELGPERTTRVDENIQVPSTVVSEAARTLITFSGATILPDIPEMYRKYPELLDFISAEKMPWKESKTLMGEIGDYIVMMRETEKEYLIGAVTNEQERTLTVPLDFLPDGKYSALVIQDGKTSHYLTNREIYRTNELLVDGNTKLILDIAPGGGACVRIFK